ncbi:hypothetical protein GCM10010121_043090 [Streptomyces brasiliensis]|uniref:Glycoside hydrolase family 5 domain-containing protein n=1 Tax=Streptomyces brasiliensis TaxID=1954 RepID=A0A917KS06_9ACTN|nr:hypothetical protein GCM10010121_043090 [Streptomyces brasiliensis]
MPTIRLVTFLTRLGVAFALLSTAAPTAVAATVSEPTARTSAADAWQPPLSTRGRYIVDARGQRFRLKAANWDGAQGSWTGSGDVADPANHHAGQNSYGIPLGLDRAPLPQLLADFRQLGLNSIRLPFSDEMIHTTARYRTPPWPPIPSCAGRRPCRSTTPWWRH